MQCSVIPTKCIIDIRIRLANELFSENFRILDVREKVNLEINAEARL